MAHFDLPLDELRRYRPERQEPEGFAAFWDATLAEARAGAPAPSFTPTDCGLQTLEVYDVSFPGYAGQPIRGWLVLPRRRAAPLPCIVEYIGYGGGRGQPTSWLLWASAGFAHFVMDSRGQGSVWTEGHTPDPEGAGPHHPGFMTMGIERPQTYYYRRLITDAVCAVGAARAHPAVDPGRLAVTGGSQGGGLALAAAGLAEGVSALMADVPFLCHYARAMSITDAPPYVELAAYCRVHRGRHQQVLATLAYFDGQHFAARATAPALFSTGLMDLTCPPSTVFAAYNHYAGEKHIEVYPYNGHEGGGEQHVPKKLRFAREHLEPDEPAQD